MRAPYGRESRAPDPVSRAFIGNGETPASGPDRSAVSIPSVRDGSGAGDSDYSRTFTECGFQRDYHVANNERLTGRDLGEDALRDFADLGASNSSHAEADALERRRRHVTGGTGLLNGLAQAFARLFFAQTNDVAAARRGARDKRSLVPDGAAGFGAATVDAKKDCHEPYFYHIGDRNLRGALACQYGCSGGTPSPLVYENNGVAATTAPKS